MSMRTVSGLRPHHASKEDKGTRENFNGSDCRRIPTNDSHGLCPQTELLFANGQNEEAGVAYHGLTGAESPSAYCIGSGHVSGPGPADCALRSAAAHPMEYLLTSSGVAFDLYDAPRISH